MRIPDVPKRERETARVARSKNAVLCYVSSGPEIHIEVTLPDDLFKATMMKSSSCTLSTKSGDTRRAVLAFD